MNIGQAAKVTGISPKMIRHYESIGLIHAGHRSGAGYRIYSDNDLHILHFIKRARTVGFSLENIRQLLSLWQNKSRASVDVKLLAQVHLSELEKKIDELSEMRDTLRVLIESCHGDQRSDCPILGGLENDLSIGKCH